MLQGLFALSFKQQAMLKPFLYVQLDCVLYVPLDFDPDVNCNPNDELQYVSQKPHTSVLGLTLYMCEV